MAEPLFLGIDAGGSTTVCLAGTASAVLGRGEGGPANPNLVGVDGFGAAIAEAVAATGAVTDTRRPVSTWVGVAGSELSTDRDRLQDAVREIVGDGQVCIGHDARLLLAAAGVDAGIAVVAGTGSSVYGLTADGGQARVGGWGFLLGDEGGGYDIARSALGAVTRAADGRGPDTALTEALLAEVGVPDIAGLRQRYYPAPPVPQVARLARSVLRLAATDGVAARIIDAAAAELATAVEACRRRLGPSEEATPVVAAGGLVGADSPLFAALATRLAAIPGRYTLTRLDAEPAIGALALARRTVPQGAANVQGTKSQDTKEEHG